MLVLMFLAQAAGCKGVQVVKSSGFTRWSGMGMSLSLPPGSWAVEEVESGRVVGFKRLGAPGRFALVRRRAPEGEPVAIALKSLFVDFKKKREIQRWRRPLADGTPAECADYSVEEDGQHVFVRACVVRRGAQVYAVAAWDAEERSSAAAALADSVLESVLFSGKGASQ